MKLIDSTGFPQDACKEEILMSERKRCNYYGVTSFQLEAESGRIIFPANGSLFQTSACGTVGFKEVPTGTTGGRINATMAPRNPDLVAFYSKGNIWIGNALTNEEIRVTNYPEVDPLAEPTSVTGGKPSYVMQEEFSRYMGFFWSPVKPDNDEVYHLLYEEVDETAVELVEITSHDNMKEYTRYPKAGCVNAMSNLKLITFKVGFQPQVKSLNFNFREYFPWCEYIVRLGWTPDGKR